MGVDSIAVFLFTNCVIRQGPDNYSDAETKSLVFIRVPLLTKSQYCPMSGRHHVEVMSQIQELAVA